MRVLAFLLTSLAAADDLRYLHGGFADRKFDEIYASGNSLWIGIGVIGGTDLYRYGQEAESPQRVRFPCQIDSIEALDGDGTLIYTGDRSGKVFSLTPENQCRQITEAGSGVQAVAWDGARKSLWVGSSDGLSVWSSADGIQPQSREFKVKALRWAGNSLWIGTERGVWKLTDQVFERQKLSDVLDNARINALEFAGGQLWVGDHEHGLFRKPLNGAPVHVDFGAKQVASLFRHGSALFIGSEKGLFQVNVADTPWDPMIKLTKCDPREPRPGELVQLKWEISNYDRRSSSDLVRQRVEMLDESGKVEAWAEVKTGESELTLPAPHQEGHYRLRLVLSDLTGRETHFDPAGVALVVRESSSSSPVLTWIGVALFLMASAGLAWSLSRRATRSQPLPSPTIPMTEAAPIVPVMPAASRIDTAPAASPGIRRLRVFLCHSSDDKPEVRKIYSWLEKIGAEPWLDERNLLPGQDWRHEITVALQTSDTVLVCLTKSSVGKAGYAQAEMKVVLDLADRQPEGAIFLIPVKLEECQLPVRLQNLHWVNIGGEKGYDQLLRALQARSSALGIQIADNKPRQAANAAGTS
jgi:hypothetical protein